MTERKFPAQVLPAGLRVSAASVRGTRPYQEDCLMYQVLEEGVLGAVCDGMGGLAQGERASACAVDGLCQYFKENAGNPVTAGEYWTDVLAALDKRVAGLRDGDGRPAGGGTTIAAVFVRRNHLTYGAVGDSMIYLCRRGRMKRLVRMHNYRMILEEKLGAGRIPPEEYERERKNGEALVSYLGMNGLEVSDVSRVPLTMEDGDRLLLCSDGLYKSLPENEIQNILERYSEEEFPRTALELIRAVFTGPPRSLDNISVLCFLYNEKGRD